MNRSTGLRVRDFQCPKMVQFRFWVTFWVINFLMQSLHRRRETAGRKMRVVLLRQRDAVMPEQIPDHRHVDALLSELRSKRVTQHLDAGPLEAASRQQR